jgi:thiamine biosynthesis protein ThiS
MNVTVNGDRIVVPESLTVTGLIQHLGMRVERVAIERNLDVLPRSKWMETQVQTDDRYEIVQLVGGG